jgi:large subunit ribosomal protein L17
VRHARRSGKLGRTSAHRRALLRNLVTALLDHESIQTTLPKARELRRVAERMITLGKRGDLHARRRALRVIQSEGVATKVFTDLADRFRERAGGYTRVVQLLDGAGAGKAKAAGGPASGRRRERHPEGAQPAAGKPRPREEKKGARAAEAGRKGGGRRPGPRTGAGKPSGRSPSGGRTGRGPRAGKGD